MAYQWLIATQHHGNPFRPNRFQNTIRLDNRADGRFVPAISLKYREKLHHPVESRPPGPRSFVAMAKKP
jgi:hypothetical protein